MRKNGFTLIELLAVIVILAIIALIATPIILGIINDAREESNERSVELYASAVRNGIAAYQLREGKEVLPGTYNETNKLPFGVEYDGKVDCENVIILEDGKISLDECTVNNGTKKYSYGEKIYLIDKIRSDEGIPVGFNVTTGKPCDYTTADITKNDGCQKFYVIADKGDRVDLLLNHNLDLGNEDIYGMGDLDTVAWNAAGDLGNPGGGPITLLESLKNNTANWKGTEIPENYSFEYCAEYDIYSNTCTATSNYHINYSTSSDNTPYKARLLTIEEVANIKGITYIKGQERDIKNLPVWLVENVYNNIGYWTASIRYYSDPHGIGINNISYLAGNSYSDPIDYGVRPVITVLKSNLK